MEAKRTVVKGRFKTADLIQNVPPDLQGSSRKGEEPWLTLELRRHVRDIQVESNTITQISYPQGRRLVKGQAHCGQHKTKAHACLCPLLMPSPNDLQGGARVHMGRPIYICHMAT